MQWSQSDHAMIPIVAELSRKQKLGGPNVFWVRSGSLFTHTRRLRQRRKNTKNLNIDVFMAAFLIFIEVSWVEFFLVISDEIWCCWGVYHSSRVNLGSDRGLRITADALDHSEFKFDEPNLNYWASTAEWLFGVAVQKKSAQILTGVVPVAWKASSVGQIWSQMKKLIFLKKHPATKLLFSTQLSHIYGVLLHVHST